MESAQQVQSSFGISILINMFEPSTGQIIALFADPALVPASLDVAAVTLERAVIFRKDGNSSRPAYQVRLFGRLAKITITPHPAATTTTARPLDFFA